MFLAKSKMCQLLFNLMYAAFLSRTWFVRPSEYLSRQVQPFPAKATLRNKNVFKFRRKKFGQDNPAGNGRRHFGRPRLEHRSARNYWTLLRPPRPLTEGQQNVLTTAQLFYCLTFSTYLAADKGH